MVFHRYYRRVPVLGAGAPGWCPVGSVARACLLLGSKLEEHAVPLARLLDAFHLTEIACDAALRAAVAAGRVPRHLTPATPEFWAAKRATVRAESIVLTQLGFMVAVATPHKPLVAHARVLGLPAPLVARALAVCNDALRTDVCARCTAPELAAAALLVAARLARCPLPGTECADGPWWRLLGVDGARLHAAAADIAAMYAWARREGIGAVEDPPSAADDDDDDDDDDDEEDNNSE